MPLICLKYLGNHWPELFFEFRTAGGIAHLYPTSATVDQARLTEDTKLLRKRRLRQAPTLDGKKVGTDLRAISLRYLHVDLHTHRVG